MAGKDSIGGWKDNAMVFQKLKACSSLKQLLGAVWTQIMDSVGIYNATCPIPMVLKCIIKTEAYNLIINSITFYFLILKYSVLVKTEPMQMTYCDLKWDFFFELSLNNSSQLKCTYNYTLPNANFTLFLLVIFILILFIKQNNTFMLYNVI